MRVCVVGLGKMGLPLAVRFAESGASVIGADINPMAVAEVRAGRSPILEEPSLSDRLAAVHAAGRLDATTDTAAAVAECDAVVVIVRLMTDPDGVPDYGALDAATAGVWRVWLLIVLVVAEVGLVLLLRTRGTERSLR